MQNQNKHLLIESGRSTYAFGLQWFVADATIDESPRKQALSFIKKSGQDFDLIGERKGEKPQYTIGKTEEGLKPKAYAAASVVAETVPPESWIYVAKIENFYWITYGNKGNIMPEGDKIYEDEASARDAFNRLEPQKWKYISIPREWKESHDKDFYQNNLIEVSDPQEIFDGKPSKDITRLETLSATRQILTYTTAFLLVAGLAFGAWTYLASGPTGPTPEQQAQEAERLAQLAQQEQERIYAQLDAEKPWETMPPAPALIETCLAELRKMPINPAGYLYESAECALGTTTATYQRNTSFPNWLREWEEKNPTFQVNIDLETSNAFITGTWEALPPRGPETLTDYVGMARFLNESALLISGQMSYTQPVQFVYDEYPDYIPLYGTSDLTISTTEPEQWRLALERLPGIVINTIRREAESASYTLGGNIYVSNR